MIYHLHCSQAFGTIIKHDDKCPEEIVDKYIREMQLDGESDNTKTLVLGNLRGFWSFLKSQGIVDMPIDPNLAKKEES